MQRWGKTAAGTVRWYCPVCRNSRVKSRTDVTIKSTYELFLLWITGTRSLEDIAHQYHVSIQSVHSWFKPYWDSKPQPIVSMKTSDVLVIDGLYLESRNHCVLIGKTPYAVIFWMFAERETYGSWLLFFRHMHAPRIVVCDGQRGMRSAIHDAWPTTRIQRCVVHVFQLATARLTQRPKTQTGQQLRVLVHELFAVRTRRQKRRWMRVYRKWRKQHNQFLKERTIGEQPGKKRTWWYTHKRIRSVRTLLDNALPDLFTYIGHHEIPRTTNHVEGGINSRLSELLYRHRGIPLVKKEVLVATFLSKKQGQKTNTKL
ncbi:hypothetical protein CO008_02270 [Candidatus Roizmanbacteria bacterium CG_4_8_14_3_um_filter_36_12]|uniref:IS1249 family transposase n=1 Tax=Candidatus Roizmanbacteria bacterium CG07_land_8_20_14_0_80_34_15 TaxID=1974849 RepID=A0A2M6YSA4_9BACT|nr:MAG: hypothetical protein COT02_06310 [Candidatus Roizmanbacteria bacterium CG07_land_8_20_14_0_80_34_15]PJC80308.1 MAG: hypothetical protein CO008_02270 [Candidatus Roizmanbacteria bacterium CG_4_8_14_3_um_filter_36_12]